MLDRRHFIWGLAGTSLLMPSMATAMGASDRFTLAQLQYDGSWNPRPTALRRLLLEVEKRTSILVDPNVTAISPESAELFGYPFVVLAGDRKFSPFSDKAVLNLRAFLKSGGFLFIDSAEGVMDGPFAMSVRRELARILPKAKLGVIAKDQVLYKSFFLITSPHGRLAVSDTMQGIYDGDRLPVVMSHNDLLGAWARDNFGGWKYACSPAGEGQREMAYRLGINLVMYALCVNYKADQVHVPFILRRRKWKVE